MNCIFCKIVKNEIPSDTVYEDENVRVFVDAHPKAPTHLLLIPKRHIQSIGHLQDSDEEMITQLIYTAKRIAEKRSLRGINCFSMLVGRRADG